MLFATLFSTLLPIVAAGDVFVHYMVQTLDDSSKAVEDVTRARAMGIDAFVLNVGFPGEDATWARDCISWLFSAAAGTDFKFFFSLDMKQNGDPYAFSNLINLYINHDNYYHAGPEGLPMLSTFNNALNYGPSEWNTFRSSLASDTYFVPAFDQVASYYESPDIFWSTWSGALDGVMSWERAWPEVVETHENISSGLDFWILDRAQAAGKDYMAALSTLQYKHIVNDESDAHWFRSGDVVMPERMTQLLSLPVAQRPEFVQIQTWNDAGESHYIGNLHDEGNTDAIKMYANSAEHPHTGWQPIFASFAAAWKTGAADASQMHPPAGWGADKVAVGAMWHREFLATSSCSGTDGKPRGAGAAVDSVNWAVVLNDVVDAASYSVQVYSGDVLIATDALAPGLNYKAVGGVNLGKQVVRVVDGAGNIVLEGGELTKGITADPAGSVCTYNVQVAELV